MTACIFHGEKCRNIKTKELPNDFVLFLINQSVVSFTDEGDIAENVSRKLNAQRVMTETFWAKTNDVELCDLSYQVQAAAVVVCELSLRNPQIYFGVAVAAANNIPIIKIVDERFKQSSPFDDLKSYPSKKESRRAFEENLFKDILQAVNSKSIVFSENGKQTNIPKRLLIDQRVFTDIFTKLRGSRTDKERALLAKEWDKVVEYCNFLKPGVSWAYLKDWHNFGKLEEANILSFVLPIQHRQKARGTALSDRQVIESSIYETSQRKLQWTLMFPEKINLSD